MNRLSALTLTVSAFALMAPSVVSAQVKGTVGEASDVVIQGSILEPEKLVVTDDTKLTTLIKATDGFKVDVFARDLINPRMLAVSQKGIVYATRRTVGDVVDFSKFMVARRISSFGCEAAVSSRMKICCSYWNMF